jgi:hypothetical protein
MCKENESCVGGFFTIVMLLVGLIEIETRISLNLAMKLTLDPLPLLSRIKQI